MPGQRSAPKHCAPLAHSLTLTRGNSWRDAFATRHMIRCWHCDYSLPEPVSRDARRQAVLGWLLGLVLAGVMIVAIVATVMGGQTRGGAGDGRGYVLERAGAPGWHEVLRVARRDR